MAELSDPKTHRGAATSEFPQGERARWHSPLWAIGILWTLLLVAGQIWMLHHAFQAEKLAEAPVTLPEELRSMSGRGVATLIMAIHPECACTDASLECLARLLAIPKNRPTVVLLFAQPTGYLKTPHTTGSWREAERIPGAVLREDPHGVLCARLKLETSGETVLYDSTGHLRFHGGLTAARGDAMPGTGVDAILHAQAGGPLATYSASASVFGCSLRTRPSQ